jgi:hypothetical protein
MTTTVWKKAVETVDSGPDTGDILMPLKRVFDKYIKHISRINTKASTRGFTENENRGILYYGACAQSLKTLIDQGEEKQ